LFAGSFAEYKRLVEGAQTVSPWLPVQLNCIHWLLIFSA